MKYDNIEAISKVTILEATWTNCPEDVKKDIRTLWQDNEYGNDLYYHSWDSTDDEGEYPAIRKYLDDHNIEKCLIHFWW